MLATVKRLTVSPARALQDGLPLLVLGAAACGLIWSGTAARATAAIPWLLGILVFAAGFVTPPARLAGALRRPERTLLLLALQFGPLALLALALSRLPLDPALSVGLLALGVSPTDVTAPAMTLLADGDAALATVLTTASLVASTALAAPLLSRFAAGALVDRGALLNELARSIVWPLCGAIALRYLLTLQAVAPPPDLFDTETLPQPDTRTRIARTALARGVRVAPAVSALAVLALVAVVAGGARGEILSRGIFVAAAVCLLYNLVGCGAGWLLFRALDAPPREAHAGVFAAGMREFGVAAAIAASVRPGAAAIAGVYGVIILITAPLLARLLRRGG